MKFSVSSSKFFLLSAMAWTSLNFGECLAESTLVNKDASEAQSLEAASSTPQLKPKWYLQTNKDSVVQSLKKSKSIAVGIERDIVDLGVSPLADGSGPTVNYRPNTPHGFQVRFSSEVYSFSATIPGKPTSEKTRNFGKTRSRKFRFDVPYGKWYVSAHYNSTQGFYVDESSKTVDNWELETVEYQLPKMKVRSYGISSIYTPAPHRFSFAALVDYTQKQKSGHAALLGLSLRQDDVFNAWNGLSRGVGGSRIHTLSHNKEIEAVERVSIATVIPSAGYGGLYVMNSGFQLGGYFLMGYGYGDLRYKDAHGRHSETTTVLQSSVSLSVGFNLDSNYLGLVVTSQGNSYDLNGGSVDNSVTYSRVFYGQRF